MGREDLRPVGSWDKHSILSVNLHEPAGHLGGTRKGSEKND